jgi:hypothetical protein
LIIIFFPGQTQIVLLQLQPLKKSRLKQLQPDCVIIEVAATQGDQMTL